MNTITIRLTDIDSMKSFDSMTLLETAEAMSAIRDNITILEKHLSKAKSARDVLAMNVIPDLMDEQGVATVNFKDIGRLQVQSDIRCSVAPEYKEKIKDWMHENGFGALVKPTINSSSLKAFVKEQMGKGDKGKLPSEMLNIHPFSRATLVKA